MTVTKSFFFNSYSNFKKLVLTKIIKKYVNKKIEFKFEKYMFPTYLEQLNTCYSTLNKWNILQTYMSWFLRKVRFQVNIYIIL